MLPEVLFVKDRFAFVSGIFLVGVLQVDGSLTALWELINRQEASCVLLEVGALTGYLTSFSTESSSALFEDTRLRVNSRLGLFRLVGGCDDKTCLLGLTCVEVSFVFLKDRAVRPNLCIFATKLRLIELKHFRCKVSWLHTVLHSLELFAKSGQGISLGAVARVCEELLGGVA